MPTIQWRPAVNALTIPQSYKMLFVPRNTVGYSELAAEIAAERVLSFRLTCRITAILRDLTTIGLHHRTAPHSQALLSTTIL
ncbi:MAG: hypothetical protein ACTFAL_07885 [Candidatus Electronema sp. V4]|uniref:hypothetical protein n=1 Tax=Candidatus Electronema sp. V4 TaxID=3454756 RepID=UPI0040553799